LKNNWRESTPGIQFITKLLECELSQEEIIAKHRQRSCQGKHRHQSLDEANERAREMEAENPGHLYEGYKCRHCPKWHVGHAKPKE